MQTLLTHTAFDILATALEYITAATAAAAVQAATTGVVQTTSSGKMNIFRKNIQWGLTSSKLVAACGCLLRSKCLQRAVLFKHGVRGRHGSKKTMKYSPR